MGALSKAEDILEWNMGMVLITLFQQNDERCAVHRHLLFCSAKIILCASKTTPSLLSIFFVTLGLESIYYAIMTEGVLECTESRLIV